jgi:hypothetical protein
MLGLGIIRAHGTSTSRCCIRDNEKMTTVHIFADVTPSAADVMNFRSDSTSGDRPFARKEAWSWYCLALSVVVWFVIDSAGITKPSRYEPGVNRTYQDLADHYGFVVLPARPYRPRDKTSVSYCTSFELLRVDMFQPCRARAAPTMAFDDLHAWRDVPQSAPKTV